MAFKPLQNITRNFRFGIILRVVFLFLTLLLFVYLVGQTQYYVSMVILGIVVLIQLVQLVRYAEKTNERLTRFLESIRYSDFSQAFSSHGLGHSFRELNEAFSKVIEEFKKERSEKQESYRYLQTVVQHIGIGLICFNHEGDVELINTAAKRLFKIPTLRKITYLGEIDDHLLKTVTWLKGGHRSLVRVKIENETLQLSIFATEFRMHGDLYKLVSFQNIHSELEEKEMEAWQNLTQVLAHEIMNSITPISSLSETVFSLLNNNVQKNDAVHYLEDETLSDVKEALNTINKRSQGLMRFVNSYRDFTQIPEPKFELFSVKELLLQVKNLNKGEAESQNVKIEVTVDPESLEVTADPELVEQILINLIKNAFRALDELDGEGRIILKSELDPEGRVLIQVADNGPGIKEANLEKIFIPFYSTSQSQRHPGGGSGIGLSLSRQIMRLHRGNLTVKSREDEGTVFTLRF